MNQRWGSLGRVYYGVPLFIGQVFRATKIPSLIILIGAFGVPILLGMALAIASRISHSSVPLGLVPVGILQFQSPEIQAQAGPEILRLLQTMTPSQLEWSKRLAEFLMFDTVVVAIAIFWWMLKFLYFLVRRNTRHP